MNPNLTSVAAWSYGLAAVAYGALAIYLAPGPRGGLRRRSLLAAVGLTAAWALVNLAYVLAPTTDLLALGVAADALRSGAWYVFLLLPILLPQSAAGERAPRAIWLAVLASALVIIGLLAPAASALQVSALGDASRWSLFASLAMAIFGLMLVEQLYRGLPEDQRWNIKPLCLALAAAFVFDLYLFAEAVLFNRMEPDAWSVRGFVQVLVAPLIAISTIRNRDWTSRITLSRGLVFHSTAVVAIGVYLLFMAAAGYYVRYFGGTWGRALQVALLFAAVLALGAMAFSGSIRAKLRVIVAKHFFSYRYDYRDEWLRFTRALSVHDGKHELGQDVIKGLADMLESPAGVLWMRDAECRQFTQTARWNMPPASAAEPSDSAFVYFLREKGWVVNLEEYRTSPERYRELKLPQWLSELQNAWLIIPLASGSDLIGFVILATARTRVDVNWEVNDLLKTAARQAATFLVQTQATEALLEARKFDAFNRMSAFVVHDLKNIVAQLSLMLKNAERHRGNPEFQQDMLMTVSHSVERMKQLMMQLREGTTPVDAPRAVDLAAVIERIQRSKAGQRPVPEVRVEQKVLARGHEDRVERVIGHLVQNAIDATGKDGRVWIRLAAPDGMAMVEVGDTGQGMTPEFVRERLFKPFQTTKETGMGIGAYESFQYVQELGGRVQVDSKPGEGTCVRLLLPRLDSSADGAPPRETRSHLRDEVTGNYR